MGGTISTPPPDLLGEFIKLAQRYYDAENLEREEIEYKVQMGQKLAAVRETGQSW